MSEKVTFQELIESIAEETDNSKQFTHDFIKDFVDVINDGLEEDRNVNIAGFGKFNLRRVDEREGYNPQTEEKITIPAHNKITFKPYKDVRELVNAPYAHLEPELIEKEDDSTKEGSTDPEDSKDQSDFIPTGPPTSRQSKGEGETEKETGSEEEVPFDFDDQDDDTSTYVPFEDDEEKTGKDDKDIVEFNADDTESEDEKTDNALNEFFASSDQTGDDETYQSKTGAERPVDDEDKQQDFSDAKDEADLSGEDSVVEETLHQTDDLINESEDLLDSIDEEEKEKSAAPPSFKQSRNTRKRTFPTIIVAAAFILLLAAGGAWYFSFLSDADQQEVASQETVTTMDDQAEENNQQTQPENNQSNQDPQQPAGQNQDQSQNVTASAATVSSDSDSEGIEIQKGQTLWSIAEEKYGNPRLWPWIYGNNESIQNPNLILAGNSLSVPLPSGPGNTLNSADSVDVAKGFIATYSWFKDKNSTKARDHLWGAKLYHDNISNITDAEIDEADLAYANRAR